jgi:hypothetical protein
MSGGDAIYISELSTQFGDGFGTRITATVKYPGEPPSELYFEYDATFSKLSNPGDPFLLCLLHRAMALGLDLKIDGHVHPRLLSNLEWIVELWVHWKPERYRSIQIQAETGSSESINQADETAVLLYSGGVDSTHALLQYAENKMGRRSVTLSRALIIKGADVALNNSELWPTTVANAKAILSRFDVPLSIVKTNAREYCGDWEDSHGCVLAACAWPWQQFHNKLIFAGSVEPDFFAVAWGSHPISDPWLSLPNFEIITDTVTLSRADKIRRLCEYPDIVSKLRYCYSQKRGELNCGRCRKCVITQLTILAAGGTAETPAMSRILALVKGPSWVWWQAREAITLAKNNGNHRNLSIRLLRLISFLDLKH